MGRLFGTDGIRGVANTELTCKLAMKLGRAVASKLTNTTNKKPVILIGEDTRQSCDMLIGAVMSGICSAGCDAMVLGVIPTPAVAFLVKKYSADAGIMISASHNSFEFNGIKIFDKNGLKLADSIEYEIEKMILEETTQALPTGADIGRLYYPENPIEDYINYIKNTVDTKLDGLNIAIDCSNGASSYTAEKLFTELGAKCKILFNQPDGININHNCGSTHIKKLSKYVVENQMDFGIAFDGDADRCLAVDVTGKTLDGDDILAICANAMHKEGKLKNNAAVGTIMSNMGLMKFCENNNIKFVQTKVGDRYVLEEMLKNDYVLGGEQSGHIIFLEHSTTGDGQLTAAQLLSVIQKTGAASSLLKKYPQKNLTLDIAQAQKGIVNSNEKIKNYISSIQENLSGNGRLVIRESGTEPKIRVMIECKDIDKLEELSKSIPGKLSALLTEV